jgi:hypothetical protein
MKKILLAAVTALVLAGAAQAELYFYDSFSYTANTKLGSADSGTNWNSGGLSYFPTNRAGTLTYSGFPSGTGGQVQLPAQRLRTATGSASGSRMIWNGSAGGLNNTNLFASFLLRVDSVGTIMGSFTAVDGGSTNANPGFIFSIRNGIRGQVYISNNVNNTANFNIGIGNQTTPAAWDNNGGSGYATGTTCLLVMSYTNNAAGGWSEQLWINPAPGSSTPGTANLSVAGSSNGSTNQFVSISAGNSAWENDTGTRIYVDELRVGSAWPDVTPSGAAQFVLTVNANPGGTATGGGTYLDGSNPQIIATPSNGFLWVSWTGAVTSANSTTNVLMSTNKIVWANFTPVPVKATTFTLE